MKIIIDNRTDCSWKEVFFMVQHVIDMGKISETKKGKQYCFVTKFQKFNDFHKSIYVSTDKNNKSDRFVIFEGK